MERLTWKEIEAKYPNSWIVMDSVKLMVVISVKQM